MAPAKWQSNIVFLIDESVANRRENPGEGECNLDDQAIANLDPNAGRGSLDESYHNKDSLDLLPFQESYKQRPQKKNFEWLKKTVMLTLFKEAAQQEDYDFGRVRWTFKFFDSTRHVDHKDGRTFMPFDNDSFTNFEKQLHNRLVKDTSKSPAALQREAQNRCGAGVKYLSDALKDITGSLLWPEREQVSLNSSRLEEDDDVSIRNMVVAFFKVPKSDQEFFEFTGLQSTTSTKEFMGLLLPSAFSHTFHHKLKIRLSICDMWTATEISSLRDPALMDTPYHKQFIKCLQYLGGGQVVAVPDFRLLDNMYHLFGLIPCHIYLRTVLKKNRIGESENFENIPSHIMRAFAPVAAKNSQKISPDMDTSSVCRRSVVPSILDSSTNSQNKGSKPLHRQSSGYGDDDHLEFYQKRFQAIQAQDRLREGERKRKRQDLQSYYPNQDFRNDDPMEDDRYNTEETYSLCEKEQRLESWLNDGNFSTKRKKHNMEMATASVPMSRPNVNNKPNHVFHEPQPKLSVSRGQKMLATVKHQKQKVTAIEMKRRSNEGLDFKRIGLEQEQQLSAIKRRLKHHLEGELGDDDDDPIAWLNNYKAQLRSFSQNNIDTDDEPCLVALAQALVNNAALQYGRQRLANLKTASRKASLPVKSLLEDIFLIDFTRLNKKIIEAHDHDGKRGLDSRVRKILAFRETELQIILRLEIAWYFVEPNEEETERLLVEIARLLQIIAAYRMNPPIDDFINNVLNPTYHQIGRFMRGLYKRMNIPLPAQLAIDGSPIPGNRRDDDASMISSTSSANLYPEDSASQLHSLAHHKPPKRLRPSPSAHRSMGRYGSGRKPNSGSKKVKRQIYVSNPKLPSTSHYGMDRTESQKKAGASTKVSPKRVRRNLFDVQKKDKKDSKTLLALSSSCPSKATRSPIFKSPKGKSPMSGSGFFRAVRSRRQLAMVSETEPLGSPMNDSEVLCPESPATTANTPGGKFSMCSKFTGSAERCKQVVQESPEIKTEYDNRPLAKVASLSFYSTGNVSSKSRAWEKSETQLMAARIKDSVDLRSREETGLTLNDLEIFSAPPEIKSEEPLNVSASTGEMDTTCTTASLSFCADSITEMETDKGTFPGMLSPPPPCWQHVTGPAPDLNNPIVEALILNEKFPAIPLISDSSTSCSKDVMMSKVMQMPRDVSISPSGAVGSPANFETPSKRVQFNLNENLVNTPSRRSNVGTPRSILKDSHDVDKDKTNC